MQAGLISLLLTSLLLSGCALFQPNAKNEPICNQLKHDIIFNGATNNPQEYMQERAKLGNLDRTYREEGCS